VGAAAKVYAFALLPIALLYVARRHGRRQALVAAAIFAGVGIAIVLPFALFASDGLRYVVNWHLDRGLQIETMPGAAFAALDVLGVHDATVSYRSGAYDFVGSAPDALAGVLFIGLAASVVVVTLLFARSERSSVQLGVAVAAAVAMTLVFAKVLSPQFMLWLVPLIPLVVSEAVATWSVFAAALLLTHALWPSRYDELVLLEPLPVAILVVRNVLLVTLVVLLVLRLRRAR
jgi:hypothetical protein